MTDSVQICEAGGGGMVLPLFGDSEHGWSEPVRAILYALGMIYLFMGVAIIADQFVAAIECVTARKNQAKNKAGVIMTTKVWNDTVATLSLLALGSSAPEIALSVIDLFKKEFYFAPLGAQTISGSAAFNLLVIVAVCMMVIPSTETRAIDELPAFYVTAAVSVFAYFWLALILIVRTPNVVEIWEAVLTFLYLPALIWVSYKVDVGDVRRMFARLTGAPQEDTPDDEPESTDPIIALPWYEMSFEASPVTNKQLEVPVKRPAAAVGSVSVAYRTEGLRATPDHDYAEVSGLLEFSEEDREKVIQVEIPPKHANRVPRKFLLILSDPRGGICFDGETDGGRGLDIMTVTITTASGSGVLVRSVEGVVNFNGLRRAAEEWKDQIVSCMYCMGSPEEQKDATMTDWTLHLISLPWKMMFSLIPPTVLWGGWACFYSALGGIALLTIFISDLAELFGCVVGIRDDVTALAFVALGTSMPDLFASLTSAREEENADASIVNVTGSNSVNVFLGLGVPWTIGSIYWAVLGGTDEWKNKYRTLLGDEKVEAGGLFVVESRNLGFCVVIFGIACAAALLILHLRRKLLGAELGGEFVPKTCCGIVFICFWLGFLAICSWRVDRWEVATNTEMMVVLGSGGAVELVLTGIAILSILAYRSPREVQAEAPQPTLSRAQSGHSVGSNSNSSRGRQSLGSNSSRGSGRKDKDPQYFSEGILAVGSCTGIGVSMAKKTRLRRTANK